MAGESELLITPVSRWTLMDKLALILAPLLALLTVWSVVDGEWISLLYGSWLATIAWQFARMPRRSVIAERDNLAIVNRTRTWRLAKVEVANVWIGKSFEGRAVYVKGRRWNHRLDATLGMTTEQLEAAVVTIRAAVAAHSAAR